MRKPVEKEIANETRETSDDHVFQQIYNAIYVHDLPPGTKLKEEQLAKILVSDGPGCGKHCSGWRTSKS